MFWKPESGYPEPEQHLFWLTCPDCGQRIWRSRFIVMAYTMHYADHLGIPIWRKL
jgi:hypothetical protein